MTDKAKIEVAAAVDEQVAVLRAALAKSESDRQRLLAAYNAQHELYYQPSPDPKMYSRTDAINVEALFSDDHSRALDTTTPAEQRIEDALQQMVESHNRWITRAEEATARAEKAEADLAAAKAECERLRGLINRDRTGLAAALGEVIATVKGYSWIPDGDWACYGWKERTAQTLRNEVGYAFKSIRDTAENALRESGKRADAALRPDAALAHAEPRRRTITLCGSTKFKAAYGEWNARLTLEGNVVLSVSMWSHADHLILTPEQKALLDAVHLAKIDVSDEVFVLDVGGYIGESTRNEIRHAEATGKPVRYLSREHPEWTETDCRWVS